MHHEAFRGSSPLEAVLLLASLPVTEQKLAEKTRTGKWGWPLVGTDKGTAG
jgi:hypothetical protein